MSQLGAGLAIGLLSGVHAASWGMYKDAPHEGFERRKFLRSIVLGGAIGPIAAHLMRLDPSTASGAVLLFGVAYVLERLIAEIYKTFLRQSDQSKYTIPMQFAILGRPVESRTVRVLLGAGYSGLLLGLVMLVHRYLDQAGPVSPVMVALVGSIGGWAIGLRGGRPFVERRGRWLHLDEKKLDRADRWFERWGDAFVLFGRVTPVIRSFVAIPAGIARMPLGRYTSLTIPGSAAWCFALAGVGWALGANWERFHHAFHYADYAVLALVLAGFAWLGLRWRSSRLARRVEDPAG